jgi:hypothetical protein
MSALENDLSISMTMAAFIGISWYIGIEINFSLFILFKRWRGLYFWSCALCSWGVILQPLFIILADFGVWKNLTGSITLIYLTWFLMVVPQSWVLYSRLHLIVQRQMVLRVIWVILIFNSVVFSVPTIIIGTIAVSYLPSHRRRIMTAPNKNPNTASDNYKSISERFQLGMGSDSAHDLLRPRNHAKPPVHLRDAQVLEC